MKLDCEVIQDLLPLYAEKIASEKSSRLVEEHLASCKQCQQLLNHIRQPEPALNHTAEPLQSFRKTFRRHTASVIACSAFFTVAVIIVIWGMFFLQPGDEMGYGLLCFYLLLPLTSLICSFAIAVRRNSTVWMRCCTPVLFALIGYSLPFFVFHSTDVIMLYLNLVPSLTGVIVGSIVRVFRKRK